MSAGWTGGERSALFGRRWRTADGARATTYFGHVRVAQGRGRVSFAQLIPPHYAALRGDLVLGLRDRFALRDEPVDAVLAALLGGAARGAIALRSVREITWFRRGNHRRLESSHRGFDDFTIELLMAPGAQKDRLLSALLFPVDHPRIGAGAETGYRGESVHASADPAIGAPIGLVQLLDRAVPRDDLPEAWIARQTTTEMPAPVAERVSALLAEAWRDETHRELVEELIRHLRFVLRTALADGGRAG